MNRRGGGIAEYNLISVIICCKGGEMTTLKVLSCSILILGLCCLSGSGQATEVRLMGMGELRLVVEDEANMINLYDFGGNVAGLYLDEPLSALNGGFSFGTMSVSDSGGAVDSMPKMTYFGKPFQEILMGFIPASYKMALPAGGPLGGDFVYRMEGSALGITGDFAQAKATFEEMDPEQSITLNVFPSTIVKYNTLLADQFSLGLQGGYVRAKQTTDPETGELTMNNFGGGLGIGVLLSEAVTLGGTFNYLKPKFEAGMQDTTLIIDGDTLLFEDFSADLDESVLGFGAQGIFHVPGMLKAGAKLGYNSLSGDATMAVSDTTIDMGSVKSSGLALETKALTTFLLVPVQLGASFGYMSESVEFQEPEGTEPTKQAELMGFEGDLSTIPIGLGIIYATPMVTAGGEFHYTMGKETQEGSDTTTSSSVLTFNLGTEVSFGAAAIRGGFVMGKSDPDKDMEDDELTTKKFTLGLGFTPPGSMFKGDFAYNYVTTSPDESETEEKTSTNLFALGIKFFF